MYQHVLLVTDLKDDTDLVAQKAKWILDTEPQAQLSVLHIVEETMLGFGYELIPASALQEEIDDARCQKARVRLAEVLSRNHLEAHHVNIKTAISGRKGIVDYCHQHAVDLVVIGRHKRTGLSAWIAGATADSILPDVDSDLLVVQLAAE
ncbi:universal stress protein [Moraxella sp. FZLJ2107]|uniref:universal stress protein n=1 Tax=unclassified Moraxella TaxID=2685852 RepID=UPI0020C838F3|nr:MULTISPECIES: universal stress protein [unclassified Moraxella]UTO04184.1 universal stress protein [Moraxella sp. FZLJ2107]UTO23017.1 universal stress protein [Moraxella sp. FZLJ2109]